MANNGSAVGFMLNGASAVGFMLNDASAVGRDRDHCLPPKPVSTAISSNAARRCYNAVKLSGALAARDRLVYPARRECRAGACGLIAEVPQYVELLHVLHVLFFHIVQIFHDHRVTKADWQRSRQVNAPRGHRASLNRSYEA